MKKILILTECGGNLGYGHLNRCTAINQAIGESAGLILNTSGTPYISDPQIKYLNWIKHPYEIVNLNQGVCPSLILIDSYLADSSSLALLRKSVNFLTVIDDYSRMNYPCDLIINPSLMRPDYSDQDARIISGSDYVILRKDIRISSPKIVHNELKNLLITFGGGDHSLLIASLLPMLGELNLKIHILTGDNKRAADLKLKFKNHNFIFLGHLNPSEISALFLNTDLAISAGGQTLNELAFLGIPFITIETGRDQHWNIQGYIRAGVTPHHLYSNDPLLPKILQNAIEQMRNTIARFESSKLGRDIIDGMGTERIAKLLKYYANID